MRGLSQKIVFVTGAASGIGLATARRFLDEGASVVAVDLRPLDQTTLAKDLGKSIVLSSHILQDVESTCSSVVLMERGKVLASGSVVELTKSSLEVPLAHVTPRADHIRPDLDQHARSSTRAPGTPDRRYRTDYGSPSLVEPQLQVRIGADSVGTGR